MLSQKMAGGSMLRLIQGMSNLNVYSMPWNVSQRCIGTKAAVNVKLQNILKRPKKPVNAYFEFKNEVDLEIKQKNPELDIKERARIAGQLWRDCSQEQKDKYKEIYLSKLQKYKQDMERIEKSLSPQQKAEIAELKNDLKRLKSERDLKVDRQKKVAELDKPKRPTNAFVRFVKSQGFPSTDIKEYMKDMGVKWAKMPENQKRPFVLEYRKDLEQFAKELEAWEDKMISLGHLDLVRGKTLKEKVEKN